MAMKPCLNPHQDNSSQGLLPIQRSGLLLHHLIDIFSKDRIKRSGPLQAVVLVACISSYVYRSQGGDSTLMFDCLDDLCPGPIDIPLFC